MKTFAACMLVMLQLTAIPSAEAQLGDTSAIRESLALFGPGDRIRVSFLGTRWTGVFTRVRGDTLTLMSNRQTTVAAQLVEIDTLWQSVEALNNGARAGAVVGAVLVGFAGMVYVGLAGAEGGTGINGSTFLGGVLGAIVGAKVGSIVGAALGREGRRWELIYP